MTRIRLGEGREFDRIRAFFAGGGAEVPGVRVGPGDDAAVLDCGTVVSTDLMVEGIHFRREWLTLEEVGGRATAAALSDLAAMGARPVGVLSSVAVPGDGAESLPIVAGIRARVEAVGGVLLGGDLTRSPGPVMVDIVAVGECPLPLLRSGARAGDELWVTGALGGAAAAVSEWEAGRRPTAGLRERFASPVPRLAEAPWLRDRGGARAAIDLSDGLAGDAGHMAAASGVRVVLEADAVPLHPTLGSFEGIAPLDFALHGGEDFELLVAAPPGELGRRVEDFTREFDLRLTRVGTVEAGDGVHLVPPGGGSPHPLVRGGYDHFAGTVR